MLDPFPALLSEGLGENVNSCMSFVESNHPHGEKQNTKSSSVPEVSEEVSGVPVRCWGSSSQRARRNFLMAGLYETVFGQNLEEAPIRLVPNSCK